MANEFDTNDFSMTCHSDSFNTPLMDKSSRRLTARSTSNDILLDVLMIAILIIMSSLLIMICLCPDNLTRETKESIC